MAEDIDNKVGVISQNDPFSAEHPHLDFQKLRREGLKHIGELSGKIWTDHNTHDPGVTILEELCYALTDLGYRTTLPMADLLATAQKDPGTDTAAVESPRHENFFTPHEILSCNPTTVLDFRKLLLDVEGVRNAWLEPVSADSPPSPVVLNGLYSILIQKETGEDYQKVIKCVLETLSAHRNLCEDFSAVTILKPFEIGICADIEIDGSADAATVYKAIVSSVRSYISPELRYYTLKGLLDKGRAIEDIFVGRPMPSSHNSLGSVGFIDTEELEGLPFRDKLYGSDLYAAILEVEGVVAVKNLAFQTAKDEVEDEKTIPRVAVDAGFVAEFSLDYTCINLQTSQEKVFLDKKRIHSRFQNVGKPMRSNEHLDLSIPEGRYHPRLADYYSIQHDFPLVYGIGEGGLSNEATLLRKVQAKQLKGYLLFYDQLLANYLSQVANIRHLFSLRQESTRPDSEKHTYFSQGLDSVRDQEQLFPKHPVESIDGSILAIPVADDAILAHKLDELRASPLTELRITTSCDSVSGEIPHFAEVGKSLLEVRIRQSVRDFHQNGYFPELFRDRNGYLFILRFKGASELVLISYLRYKSQDEAREAANFAAFLASRPEYYAKKLQQVGLDGSNLEYQYDLVYDPAAYSFYLQYLMENEDLYLQRREAFLDHLLARFATRFTDYALLQFGTEASETSEKSRNVEDKSKFLSQIDDLSRDRGRAFDYLKPSWGTDNVSGFEKRVSLLAGIKDYGRRHLCKFEVDKRFRIEIEDLNGDPWFSSIETYRSKEALNVARKDLVGQLGDPATYDGLCHRSRGLDPLSVSRIFSHVATDENIKVSNHVYSLILKG